MLRYRHNWRVPLFIPFLCTGVLASGCSKHSSPTDNATTLSNLVAQKGKLLAISNGSSFTDVTNVLKGAVTHEFTVTEPDGEYRVIACRTSEDFPSVWLIFHNDNLKKITVPAAIEMETYPYQGTTASRVKSWDIDDLTRVTKTLNLPALTPTEISTEVNQGKTGTAEGKSLGEFIGQAIKRSEIKHVEKGMSARIKKDYELNQQLASRYDGSKTKPGMNVEEVTLLYGKPLKEFPTKSGGIVRIFGDNRKLEVNPAFMFSCLAVVFDADRHVASVFSHDFFNDDWK